MVFSILNQEHIESATHTHTHTESKALLKGAMKYVESNQQLLLLIGAACSGKTHTIYLVLNRKPPTLRQSTPLAERPIKVVRISTTGNQLEEVSNTEFDDMLANAVVAGVPLDIAWPTVRKSKKALV